MHTVGLLDGVNGHDVWMVEGRDRAGLTLETHSELGILRK